jgi:hypothetical protein
MQGSHEGAQSEHQYHTTRFQYCTGEHNYKTEKGSEYLSLQNAAQKQLDSSAFDIPGAAR